MAQVEDVAVTGPGALEHTRAPCASTTSQGASSAADKTTNEARSTYPTQQIEYDSSKTSPDDVYFRPAAGAAVEVEGDIDVYASHVTVMAMQAEDTDVPYDGPADVSDVTFWAMDGRNFTIDSGQDVNVIGGDYGPASSCGGAYGGGNNGIRMNRPGVAPSDNPGSRASTSTTSSPTTWTHATSSA